MIEIWKTIKEFEDYSISNFGKVKSFKKYRGLDVRILKPIKGKDGYFYVRLCKNGTKSKRIHILMFETFNNYRLKMNECVHHLDENKENNILENFQLMTNENHSRLHHKGENHPMYGKHHSEKTKKLMSGKKIGKYLGEHHSQSKLKEQDVIEIRIDLKEGILTQKEIGKKFGVSDKTISGIKTKRTWIHTGEILNDIKTK